MGDEKAEEQARKKVVAKRVAKKAARHPGTSEASDEQARGFATRIYSDKKILSAAVGGFQNDAGETLQHDEKTKGKNYLKVKSLVDKTKKYSINEALDLVKKTSYSKFDGSVEVVFNVLSKGLRGNVTLPHGTGKTLRIKIADDALVANPVIDFDILVAHPSMMPKLAKIAKILGPRGLMPNPKTGTIGENVEELVLRLRSGQQSWKTESDFPIIHTILGKVSFEEKKLSENFAVLLKSIGKDKIVSIFVKATMGPSIPVQI